MRKLVTRICNFIFGKHKNNTLPRYWILATDMAIVFIAYVIAVVLVYFNDISKLNLIVDWKRVWLFPLVYLISFLLSKTYDGMLRYSGFNDIRKIFSACTWTLLFIVFSKWLFIKFYHPFAVNFYPPFTIIGYHYLITLVLMIMLRFTIRRL